MAMMQRVFSEAIRVLYAYPIFLVALGAMILYAAIQCLSTCRYVSQIVSFYKVINVSNLRPFLPQRVVC